MKFFKIILNTIGNDNEKIIFVIPPADETDENGNSAYDEDFLLNNAEYKEYVKATKAAVVKVSYILYESVDGTKLNYDELLKNENEFFKIDWNDYLIEVKKAKPKSGGSGGKKSSTVIYAILGAVVAAVAIMLIYGAAQNKSNDDTIASEINSEDIADTYSTSEEDETAEPSSESESKATEDIRETTTSAEKITTESDAASTEESVYKLTFDKNGGTGYLTNKSYAENTVVDLPFTGLSKKGYSLVGWATAPAEPYTIYDNEINKYVMPPTPTTLYAIWTAAEYEVIYNYQIAGVAVVTKERSKYGELIELMDVSSISSDKGEFVGWGLLPDETVPVQSLTMPDGGIELYAIYE